MPQVGTSPEIVTDLDERSRETVSPENLVTARRRIPWRIAPPAFVRPMTINPADLSQHALQGRRVFIVGPTETGSAVALWSAQAKRTYTDGHYPLVVAHNGAQVTYAESWFGEGDYGPSRAADVWSWLERELQRAWRDPWVRLLITPATTGRDLFARSIPKDVTYPVMPIELQDVIRSTAGQGRMEIVGKGDRKVRRLYEYDARMAYVALLDGLPVGVPEHLGSEAAAWFVDHPYHEGRYRVTWTAPDGWDRPGILPAYGDGEREWEWPTTGTGWCGGAELFMAARFGWDVTIHEAYVWPNKADPFRAWRDRLLRVLAASEELPAESARMVRAAVRAMVLHAVGAFHGAAHKTSDYGTQPPAGATKIRALRDGRFSWLTTTPAAWPEMAHPEWTATIWGRARARLVSSHRGTAGFMHCAPETLVAFRTDAIYTTEPTGWDEADDGSPGRYRMKLHELGGSMLWPRNGTELLRLRDQAVGR